MHKNRLGNQNRDKNTRKVQLHFHAFSQDIFLLSLFITFFFFCKDLQVGISYNFEKKKNLFGDYEVYEISIMCNIFRRVAGLYSPLKDTPTGYPRNIARNHKGSWTEINRWCSMRALKVGTVLQGSYFFFWIFFSRVPLSCMRHVCQF